MKEKRNTLLTGTLSAIGIAATIFCIVCIIFDCIYKGGFHTQNYSLTKMIIGVFAIGLGFGIPTIVYNNDKMPVAAQTVIHMGIGCIVMTVTAFLTGWIPLGKGAGAVIVTVAGEISVAFVIWIIFYIHNKKLANRINKRINEINR